MSEPFVPGLDRDADLRATAAERDRAMRACEKMAARIAELETERDAERRTIAALYIERDAALGEVARLREAAKAVIGCFDAAEAEGLIERMSEADDGEPGSLVGLIRRRLSFAKGYATAALAAPDTGGAADGE